MSHRRDTKAINTVGIVVVAHSRALADAAVAFTRGMATTDGVRIEVAAGLDDGTLGTDATAVAAAIERADDGAGVLVLMDLGSAILAAETALEFTDAARRVVLSPAPLVEGLFGAAIMAASGADLARVAAEANNGLAPKRALLKDR